MTAAGGQYGLARRIRCISVNHNLKLCFLEHSFIEFCDFGCKFGKVYYRCSPSFGAAICV